MVLYAWRQLKDEDATVAYERSITVHQPRECQGEKSWQAEHLHQRQTVPKEQHA